MNLMKCYVFYPFIYVYCIHKLKNSIFLIDVLLHKSYPKNKCVTMGETD